MGSFDAASNPCTNCFGYVVNGDQDKHGQCAAMGLVGLLFIESDRAIGYLEPTVLGNVLLHFPFVNVVTQAFYTQKLAKLKQAIQATNNNPEESNNILQDQFDRLSSDLLEFKILSFVLI